MSTTVGVREFRQNLTTCIDQTEPVTITRHGEAVGLFIPVHRDREADVAAYREAARKANAMLDELGMTEDEFVEEFDARRRAEHEADQIA